VALAEGGLMTIDRLLIGGLVLVVALFAFAFLLGWFA